MMSFSKILDLWDDQRLLAVALHLDLWMPQHEWGDLTSLVVKESFPILLSLLMRLLLTLSLKDRCDI